MIIEIHVPKYVSESDKFEAKKAIEREISESAIPFSSQDIISIIPTEGISEIYIIVYGENRECLNVIKEIIKANHPMYNISLIELV